MNVVLFRNGTRALILPGGKDLIDCPPLVRHWLGTPITKHVTDLSVNTPMPGIDPPTVLAELLRNQFCALDVCGVVRAFEATRKELVAAPSLRISDRAA